VVTLPSFRLSAGRKLVNRLRLKAFLEREARAGHLEVVEAPDYEGTLPFGLKNAPVVVRLHQSWTLVNRRTGKALNKKIVKAEQRHLEVNPAWIAVSEDILALTEEAFGLSPARSTVIPNFVEPSDGDAPSPDLPRPYVLYAGTVSAWKGAIDLARAARIFLPRHPGLTLVYLGREHDDAHAAIRETLGPLAERVVLTGAVPRGQVRAAMREAAVLVMPSRLESSSLVALEAMSEGCPVIVADSRATRELVRDGENALVARAEDPEALAGAVSRILDDRGLRDRLASSARHWVGEELTLEKNVAATLAFYGEVLRERRAARG
jgi:glycosyltransferase involved in cell wall biosynthesis